MTPPASPPGVGSGAGATFRFVCDTVPSGETVVHVAEYPAPLRERCQRASGAKSRFKARFHQDKAGCVARNSCVGRTEASEFVGMGGFSPGLEGVRPSGSVAEPAGARRRPILAGRLVAARTTYLATATNRCSSARLRTERLGIKVIECAAPIERIQRDRPASPLAWGVLTVAGDRSRSRGRPCLTVSRPPWRRLRRAVRGGATTAPTYPRRPWPVRNAHGSPAAPVVGFPPASPRRAFRSAT